MDFDLSWLLLGIPLAFVAGWIASRFDLKQMRMENKQAPKAYFKGLNFLLNEQQDQAIDAFIEAVQKDPDTSELHFALGNLFRRRGEYERAVRVHEHLLSRGDLTRAERNRAQHALALDFLKAGLLDRAEEALRKLEKTPYEGQALLSLLTIYERTRDWDKASKIATRLEELGQGEFGTRQAHYLCEKAKTLPSDQADHLLRMAARLAPDSARPRMELAALQRTAGDMTGAFETLMTLAEKVPPAMPLVARPLAEAAQATGYVQEAVDTLVAGYELSRSIDVVDAIASLAPTPEAGREVYVKHLRHEPSLVAASKWLVDEEFADKETRHLVHSAIDTAAKPLMRYRCAACGFEAKQHFWQCPGCQAWDSFPARRIEEL
jgi:lipopolysaccharide biosynthesis regulator YciM